MYNTNPQIHVSNKWTNTSNSLIYKGLQERGGKEFREGLILNKAIMKQRSYLILYIKGSNKPYLELNITDKDKETVVAHAKKVRGKLFLGVWVERVDAYFEGKWVGNGE